MGLANIIEQVRQWDSRRKLIASVLLILSFASIIMLFSWASAPDYQVLFSNLQTEDAGMIIQKLGEMKVPYKATSRGILVPADRVYELRLQLAGMGLPQGGGIGYEIFDRTGLGTTDFVQKVNYRRALQGELARTIRSLQEVADCRIHLSIPEKSIFSDSEDHPKASVLLKLRPGVRLSRTQVQGIVHLVSSSVEGLTIDNVTVVDQRGNVLTSPADEVASLSNSQIEYQRNLEKDIERRVVSILEPVVGKDKVRARASVTVDFTRKEETVEQYDPDGQVVRSEQKTVEQKLVAGTAGVPGVQSNLPKRRSRGRRTSEEGLRKKTETLNYEISKIVSHVVRPTGTLKRLSLAVLVDGRYSKDEKTGESVFQPRTEEELRQYEEIVKRAVGFSAERGDAVQVISLPFSQQEEPMAEARKGFDYQRYILPAVRYGTILVLSFLVFLFLVKPLMKQLSMKPPKRAMPMGGGQSLTQEIGAAVRPKEIERKDEIVEWAKNNPEQAAFLIKQWVEEES